MQDVTPIIFSPASMALNMDMLQVHIKQAYGLHGRGHAPIAGLELSLSERHVSHDKIIGLRNEVFLACRHARLINRALTLACISLPYHLHFDAQQQCTV